MDARAIYFHTLDARVRRGIRGGDFASWIGHDLGLTSRAEDIGRINLALGGLEQVRVEARRLIDAHLSGAEAEG